MNISTESLIKELNVKFSGFNFKYQELEFGGKIPIFFAYVNCAEQQFASQWSNIVNFIALNFQAGLDNEFQIWNIYLFFITKKGIDKHLKVNIENNTFSCRKIIVTAPLSEAEIINRYLRCSGITTKKSRNTVKNKSFTPDPDVLETINQLQPGTRQRNKTSKSYKLIAETTKMRLK